MKHIVLFGAGKSATVLIDYLKELATEQIWQVTVADGNIELLNEKVGVHALVKSIQLNVEDDEQLNKLVSSADVVISLLPPNLHFKVALSCLANSKHLLTASYLDEAIKTLGEQVAEKKILFLCEMGLDPGIDHMSAMELIDKIKAAGGKITSFKSHCGGLVAPESDDNPWHYKISWNPRNIILAGKAGAVYKLKGNVVRLPYEELFTAHNIVEIPGQVLWSWYANRDSLPYMSTYGLQDADTFIRTTLRHPEFCFGWKNMVNLQLTNDEIMYDTDGMSVADFFRLHFERFGFSEWLAQLLSSQLSYAKDILDNLLTLMEAEKQLEGEGNFDDTSLMLVNEKGELDQVDVEDIKDKAAAAVALKMHEANLSLKQLFYLGLDDTELINRGKCSAADILQFILEQKLALQPTDKDMVVMVHEIDYEIDGVVNQLVSSLVVIGTDNRQTAMAKCVGLPLGIAAKLLLQGQLNETGIHIPTIASIYEPVLFELQQFGIVFNAHIND